jgi:hypothetical protein
MNYCHSLIYLLCFVWYRISPKSVGIYRRQPVYSECPYKHTHGDQNNGSTRKLRNRICVGYTVITSVNNTECSFDCLHSVVPVLVTIDCVEWQSIWMNRKMWDLSDFERGETAGARVAGASVIKSTTSTATVSKVISAYANHGKTSAAKRNSGRKSTMTERDRRTSYTEDCFEKSHNYCSKGDSRPRFHKNSPTWASQIQHPRYGCNC